MTPAKFWSRYAIAESVWRAEMPAGCSRPSSPPNRTAWAWACRSADRSSSPTAGGYRPPATPGPAPRSSSSCRGTRRATRRDRQLDIASVREALGNLLRSVGLPVQLFGSAPEFLQSKLADVPSCLILDIRLPRVSGLDFQADLAEAGIHIPIIFMTGHGDIPMTVRAMKAGAVDFLTKPFRDQDMLDAVTAAIERDRKSRQEARILSDLKARFATLSVREQEVLTLVTAGLMNKQVAAEIGIAEITVKIHRGNIMRKMAAKSLAELVKMAQALGVQRAAQQP